MPVTALNVLISPTHPLSWDVCETWPKAWLYPYFSVFIRSSSPHVEAKDIHHVKYALPGARGQRLSCCRSALSDMGSLRWTWIVGGHQSGNGRLRNECASWKIPSRGRWTFCPKLCKISNITTLTWNICRNSIVSFSYLLFLLSCW